jgi:hypothetical protein
VAPIEYSRGETLTVRNGFLSHDFIIWIRRKRLLKSCSYKNQPAKTGSSAIAFLDIRD